MNISTPPGRHGLFRRLTRRHVRDNLVWDETLADSHSQHRPRPTTAASTSAATGSGSRRADPPPACTRATGRPATQTTTTSWASPARRTPPRGGS